MNKKILFYILVFAVSTVNQLSAQAESDEKKYKEITVASVTFKWVVIEKNLDIVLSAPTEGWISVGFEPTSMMKDANIIIGYVEGKEVIIDDQFGYSATSHRPDIEIGGTNDVTILGGFEESGNTTLKFSIPLESKDSFDRKLEEGKKYKVIVAYGKKDDLYSYHKRRGAVTIKL